MNIFIIMWVDDVVLNLRLDLYCFTYVHLLVCLLLYFILLLLSSISLLVLRQMKTMGRKRLCFYYILVLYVLLYRRVHFSRAVLSCLKIKACE